MELWLYFDRRRDGNTANWEKSGTWCYFYGLQFSSSYVLTRHSLNSQNLKLNHGILYLEVGRLPLLLDMGYHWRTSFLSLLMASDISTSALVVLLPRLL